MANYILTGNLNVNGNVVVTGTLYDIRSLDTLVKKLEEGGYKGMMELTNNERTIDNLEVNDLILVNFDCSIKSILNVSGTTSSINMEVLE
jgi:hypothetical protein